MKKMDYPEGKKMDYPKGGKNAGHGPMAEVGFKCLEKHSLTDKFWTQKPKHGQA